MLLKRGTEQRSRKKREGDEWDYVGRGLFGLKSPKEKNLVKPQKSSSSDTQLALVKEIEL